MNTKWPSLFGSGETAEPLRPEVARELLRVSIQPQGKLTLFQFVFLNGGMATYFALGFSLWRALLWMAIVGAGSLVFVFAPQPLPVSDDLAGLKIALRRHSRIVGVHAGAHGSAGFLLFDAASFAHQMLLASIMIGMLVAFIEFVSRCRQALRLTATLLMVPILAMLALHLKGDAAIMAALLLFGFFMMLQLVQRRCQVLETFVQHRLDESLLRRTAQDALAQARRAQEDKLRFFAAANHDLRQPVMAIGIYTELLRRQIDEAQSDVALAPLVQLLQPHVGALREAQTGLDTLVGQLLDIDHLESAASPRLGAVPLAPLLMRQVKLHQAAAVRDGARIILRCPLDATAWSHAMQLERILSNLLDNAVKFTPGGTILVACRRRAERWRLEIRDSGIGIAVQEHGLVFNDFEQLANPERDQTRGHGLGLAIVRRIAAQLGTAIELRSAPGKGSVFAFDLRAARPDPAATSGHAARIAAPHAGAPSNILVVEDDRSLADSLAALMRSERLTAHFCTTAADALKAAAHQVFDVALCDFRLPGPHDGFACAKAVQSIQPGVSIVVMSADLNEALAKAIEARGWLALRKPIAPESLLRALGRRTEVPVQS
ncbi:hypothetical protein BH11PSE13_BH11PSE13_11670 [soil metagenome]